MSSVLKCSFKVSDSQHDVSLLPMCTITVFAFACFPSTSESFVFMSSTLAPGKQWTAASLLWEGSESPRMIESPITTVETGDGSESGGNVGGRAIGVIEYNRSHESTPQNYLPALVPELAAFHIFLSFPRQPPISIYIPLSISSHHIPTSRC